MKVKVLQNILTCGGEKEQNIGGVTPKKYVILPNKKENHL